MNSIEALNKLVKENNIKLEDDKSHYSINKLYYLIILTDLKILEIIERRKKQ